MPILTYFRSDDKYSLRTELQSPLAPYVKAGSFHTQFFPLFQ